MSRTKLVIASLVTAGVIFTGALPASATLRPTLDATETSVVSKGDVEYTVGNLESGCRVKTVLGGEKENETSTGAEVTGTLIAPKNAGSYSMTTTVMGGCGNMNGKITSLTITVGERIQVISSSSRSGGAGFATKVTGELGVDGIAGDVGTKVTATVNGKSVTFKTNTDGAFKFLLPSATFTKAGIYKVVLTMASNTSYFMKKANFNIRVRSN